MTLLDTLVQHHVITDHFDHTNLESELTEKYEYFYDKFERLFTEKASIFNLKDCVFYIRNDINCNAFATNPKGYNIIGITHGYAIRMMEIFSAAQLSSMVENGLFSFDTSMLSSYEKIIKSGSLKIHEFMLECSIYFTMGHEFQHILQFNSSKIARHYHYSENASSAQFDFQKHLWEFDADRFGAYDMIRYVFSISRNFIDRDVDKVLVSFGLGSVFISKILFYLKVVNPNERPELQPFYTKEKSHPHPLVRIMNIIEYYYDNLMGAFPTLELQLQDLLNISLWIVKKYLDVLIPEQTLINQIFDKLHLHLEDINLYNQELFDNAIQDKSVRELLLARRINFE